MKVECKSLHPGKYLCGAEARKKRKENGDNYLGKASGGGCRCECVCMCMCVLEGDLCACECVCVFSYLGISPSTGMNLEDWLCLCFLSINRIKYSYIL